MADTASSEGPIERALNPLSVELDGLQLELLEKIYWAAYDSPHQSAQRWPTWDWVSRELCRYRTEYVNPEAVLQSLPHVAAHYPDQDYGLVWRNTYRTPNPMPTDRVGLTIAGLEALGRTRSAAQIMADDFACKVRDLAQQEQTFESGPDDVASTVVKLSGPIVVAGRRFDRSGNEKLIHGLDMQAEVSVLMKEYAQLHIVNQDPENVTASLGPWLRRFSRIEGAEDYLDLIASDQQVQQSAPQLRPGELALILDHVSYVLKDRPDWGPEPMARPRDYRTAASLTLPALSAEEFQARMSDLWTVLGGLTIPDVKVPDPKNPPGALVRLKLWLNEHVTDPTSRDRAVAAIENVRSVGALRNYTQHPSQETRRNAVAACSRLGLPYPIQDWAAAWDHVRAKVAEAFYILSQEAKA